MLTAGVGSASGTHAPAQTGGNPNIGDPAAAMNAEMEVALADSFMLALSHKQRADYTEQQLAEAQQQTQRAMELGTAVVQEATAAVNNLTARTAAARSPC